MSDINFEKACEVVKEFIDLLERNRCIYDTTPYHSESSPFESSVAKLEAVEKDSTYKDILQLQPIIEKISSVVQTNVELDVFKRKRIEKDPWGWKKAQDAAQRLFGILNNKEKSDIIFKNTGPALIAHNLHNWVWDAAKNLWAGSHYSSAILEAAKAVELQVQHKLNCHNINGKKLYANAFSTKDPTKGAPRLRLPHIDKDSQPQKWSSAHEGAQHYGMGCVQGIRNPRAHGTDSISEQEALEQLAALSVLARWVEAGQATHPNLNVS